MNTMIRAFLLGLFVVALTTACSKAEEAPEVITIDLSETIEAPQEATAAEVAEAKEEAVDAIQAAKDAAAE